MQVSKIIVLIPLLLFALHIRTQDSISTAPNIVLILVDDAALMDLGAYGGEAYTPNIDSLTKQGTMLTNHHASPMCAPSRAMLLTGYDSHLTGVPNLPLFLPPEYSTQPGYEGILNNKVKTVATRLKQNGYRTYITGKWHLGHTENTLPTKRGFDRSYILDASGADNYYHKAYLPTQSKPPWFKDGNAIDLPDDFYSSKNLVDEMIAFMEEEENKEKPFFSYLSFLAIHIPVQAPKKYIDKYDGVYDQGWDVMRASRFNKAKDLGLIPKDASISDLHSNLGPWEDQSEEDKKLKSKAMAVNAAMLEAMDFHIGRYIKYLKNTEKIENTIFIITSDNGPEASDPSLVKGMNLWMKYAGYNRDVDQLGQKGSWNFIGPEFASACASPSSLFKFYAGEGGLRVPLIFSGPNIPKDQRKDAFTFITDITPSILTLANISKENEKLQFSGKSILPLILNESDQVYEEHESIGMEAAAQKALFKGDYKLVNSGPPYGDGIWKLFNLASDPGETIDLSKTDPNLFSEMMADYKEYTIDHQVLEMPDGYETVKEVENKMKRKLKPWLIMIMAIIIGFMVCKWVKKTKRKEKK